jgi:hypothetical protein
MCEVLGVSRSGFHGWERRAPSNRALSDAWLTSRITEIHERARGVYGSRRVPAELRLGEGIQVSRRRVRRLMRQAGISGLVKVKRGRTTIRVPGVRVADDLVAASSGRAPRTCCGSPTSRISGPGPTQPPHCSSAWRSHAKTTAPRPDEAMASPATSSAPCPSTPSSTQLACPSTPPRSTCCDDQLSPPNMSRSGSASRPAMQGSRCRWDPRVTATTTRSLRASSRP